LSSSNSYSKRIDNHIFLLQSIVSMSKIFIAYSSIGGNTELTVQKLVELIQDRVEVNLKRVDVATEEDINNADCVIFASPTYGQGALEIHFETYLKKIKNLINNKKFAVIGLGDSKYYPEYLTESGAILEEFIKTNNGQLVQPALRIGMPPIKFIDKLVPRWAENLLSKI
jgi:flavodoxin